MSEQVLQYQVGRNGEVINLQTKEGVSYVTQAVKVARLPWPRSGIKTDKWSALKRLICHLPPNTDPEEWYVFPNWPNNSELKLVRNALAKWDKDRFMQSMLNGKKLQLSADYNNLKLGVRVIANG